MGGGGRGGGEGGGRMGEGRGEERGQRDRVSMSHGQTSHETTFDFVTAEPHLDHPAGTSCITQKAGVPRPRKTAFENESQRPRFPASRNGRTEAFLGSWIITSKMIQMSCGVGARMAAQNRPARPATAPSTGRRTTRPAAATVRFLSDERRKRGFTRSMVRAGNFIPSQFYPSPHQGVKLMCPAEDNRRL